MASSFNNLLGPLDLVRQLPGEAFATSDRRQWTGLQAVRYREQPPNEASQPSLTHHLLVLFLNTPKELELRSEGIDRIVPPPPGSILLVPAGNQARWRWGNQSDSLHVFVEPERIARVAIEAFELDPGHLQVQPLDGLQLPQLRAAMLAVNAELTGADPGGSLASESLTNLIAIHLLRNASTSKIPVRGTDRALPRSKLLTVLEYIDAYLHAEPTLEQMAAAVHLSTYHFARQFKVATGMPPHQYVIARRVERAQRLLGQGANIPLAEIAASAGFSDQSQFTHHFRRVTGVTPRQFRISARST